MWMPPTWAALKTRIWRCAMRSRIILWRRNNMGYIVRIIGVIACIGIIAALAFIFFGRKENHLPAGFHPMIRVSAPMAGAVIASPLIVEGEARGLWYFEASFPIAILDANRAEIAR